MPTRSRAKRRMFFLAANWALFCCTVTSASLASVIFMGPASEIRQAGGVSDQQQVPETGDSLLLDEVQNEIEEKDKALEETRVELPSGYVVAKDIQVTDTENAYWLSEPKLMLGVNSLSGGRLLISFADRTELISIGERIDFRVDDCDCFLLLKSSKFGHASFRYACAPAVQEHSVQARSSLIDARLN